MFNFQNTMKAFLAISLVATISSCKDDEGANSEEPGQTQSGRYVLGVGVTTGEGTNHYVVQTEGITSGTISAVGNGIELIGYHDFASGGNSVFSIGGLGVVDVNALQLNASGVLERESAFVFDNALSGLVEANSTQMLGTEFGSLGTGETGKFYIVNTATASVTSTVNNSVEPFRLDSLWPTYTGAVVHGDKAFVTYYLLDPNTYATPATDTNYVAVYSYPEMELQEVIKDTRTGPSGAFGTQNGIIKTENGDIYTMSSSNISNGFSQSTKPGGFLRINSGTTAFDPNYFFNVDDVTGGYKISHMIYLGDGKIMAEITTIVNQTPAAHQWSDGSLKTAIVDLNSQTVSFVEDIPVHNGNGGRSFAALHDDNGMVYFPITDDTGTYIWEVNPETLTATKGAKVEASYVGGIFHL